MYRERIEDYMGPDELFEELRTDSRFDEQDRRQVLWAGVLLNSELAGFRNNAAASAG
jgi:hypothetical protein